MKKKLSVLLALVLAFSVFAVACGKKDDASEETEAPAESEASEESKESEAPAESEAAPAEEESEEEKPAGDATGLKIEVVSKGLQHQFWVNVQNGAKQAAEDYGADMHFDGPPSESDIQDQVNMLENAITAKPDAICLAALDVKAVMTSLKNAKAAGIPIIGFDSGVPGAPEGVVYANASTDNHAAGGIAADELYKVAKEEIDAATADAKVRIAVLSQDASGESIISRTEGFIEKMTELVGEDKIAVVGQDKYAAGDEEAASVILSVGIPAKVDNNESDATATALLEEENVIAIYASNEFAAESMIRAGEALGGVLGNRAEDKTKIWAAGFDAGKVQREAVQNGVVFGSVTQDPIAIGYKAVELAVKAAQGEEVEDIDTGAKWYNAENLSDPDIDPLVYE